MEREDLHEEIERRRAELHRLEAEAEAVPGGESWRPGGFYTLYYVLSGMILGTIGASASLVFNIVGSLLVGQEPLRLIRVYATYLGGEEALAAHTGAALALDILLFLATGGAFGAVIHVILSRRWPKATLARRLALSAAMGLVLWLVNFYGLISWSQPMISGKGLILELIPFWVAALTHVVFAATVGLLQPWGIFSPPESPSWGRTG